MHHAITVGGLLLGIGAMIGLTSAGFGVIMTFAEGMSDAPQEGQGAGCAFFAGGVLLLGACLIGLIL